MGSNQSLFSVKMDSKCVPLAYRLCPKSLDDYVGQAHLLADTKPLSRLIQANHLVSILFWGPPGCGKTALSRLLARHFDVEFMALNAVMAKVQDIRDAIQDAKEHRVLGRRSILFIDEIHRFNKAQQDALLPSVEKGDIVLFGATTENPYFSVNPSLVSRCQIMELRAHDRDSLTGLINRASKLSSYECLSDLTDECIDFIVAYSKGDARRCLNCLDLVSTITERPILLAHLESLFQETGVSLSTDEKYDIMSAYIKSLRGSDPDAALYWLARLLKGGEDPRYIARRLMVFASEDVGNADPMALVLATSLGQAVQTIGMPEVRINFGQVTTYLATAPKSNASYMGINKAMAHIDEGHMYKVPNYLRDTHYAGAKKMGHGDGYLYSHDHDHAVSKQAYLPDQQSFYSPTDRGFESTIQKRMAQVEAWRASV